jgi:hypothetical protein
MKALSKRVAQLERATPEGARPVLVLVGQAGHNPDTLTGCDAFPDHPRREGESADDYIWRLEDLTRETRGRALPLVSFARFGPLDLPDDYPICMGKKRVSELARAR